jgi:hypothetical protein
VGGSTAASSQLAVALKQELATETRFRAVEGGVKGLKVAAKAEELVAIFDDGFPGRQDRQGGHFGTLGW